MGAELTALKWAFRGLSLSTGWHLTLPKAFALFEQLLEMFGAVSVPPKVFWWWGGSWIWEL